MNDNDRSIVGLAMIGHALVHTFELSIPILVPLWLAYFDQTAAIIGVVVAVGYALFGIGALPGGVLTDAVGSRRLIAACLVGMGLSFLVLSIAPSVWGVAVALVLWGIAASVYHPAGLRLISTGVDDRSRGFAYHGMAGNIGIAIGPLVTAVLLMVLDWRLVVLVLTIPAILAGIFAIRLDIDETAAIAEGERVSTDGGAGASEVRSLSEFLGDTRVLFASTFAVVFGMVMFSGTFYRGVLTFLPEIVGAFPRFEPIQVGAQTLEPANYFYVGILLVGIAGQYVGGRITDYVRTEAGLLLGFGTLAVVAAVFVQVAMWSFWAFLVVGAVLGFFLFLVQPLYQVTVAEYTPPEARGLSYGFTYLGIFGVGAAGGAIAGILLTYASAGVLFTLLSVFAVIPGLLAGYLVWTADGPILLSAE